MKLLYIAGQNVRKNQEDNISTNFFFNNFKSSQEQLLLENLIIEAIKIYGEDMWYMPRKLGNFDRLYTADDQSEYEQAFMVELYIK